MNRDSHIDLPFREIQQFRQIWIWVIIIFIAGIFWYGFLQQVIFGKPFGSQPVSAILLWILWIVFGIGLPWLFYSLKLIVEIRKEGIYIRFLPLQSRIIYFKDLKSYEVRQYKPIWEYGGWGIRWSLRKGWAYNVSGNRGVQLELLNGKRLLIGSQRPEELARAIKIQMKQ